MVNPDGSLRLDRLGEGRVDTGVRLQPAEVERIIRLVASHVRAEAHADNPIVSAELARSGERFEGLLPPVARGPCFAIRKPAAKIYTLADYVADRIMSPIQAEASETGRRASGATSWSPAAPARARPRWPMRCSPKSPSSTSG